MSEHWQERWLKWSGLSGSVVGVAVVLTLICWVVHMGHGMMAVGVLLYAIWGTLQRIAGLITDVKNSADPVTVARQLSDRIRAKSAGDDFARDRAKTASVSRYFGDKDPDTY